MVFETLVRVAAYLELLDSFETAKKKFSEGDRNERQAEYPKGKYESQNPFSMLKFYKSCQFQTRLHGFW